MKRLPLQEKTFRGITFSFVFVLNEIALMSKKKTLVIQQHACELWKTF